MVAALTSKYIGELAIWSRPPSRSLPLHKHPPRANHELWIFILVHFPRDACWSRNIYSCFSRGNWRHELAEYAKGSRHLGNLSHRRILQHNID